ncbi:MAG: bile acid:sodium symporter [Anaerolineae bacterium]|nr:bile acid:sodium symporter [Anaerolineae bacterium]
MTGAEFFTAIAQISGLLFIVSSMLAMGMSLTMQQIIAPLKELKLVVLALLANFVLVPLLAYLITRVIPLEQPLQIGLIVLATAAGAPFLPKLVQGAKGNIALGVGLMVLLMVVTIVYLPLVLPLLLPGVAVNPWDIAKSLIVLMLVPLALGLLIRSHSAEESSHWQPMFSRISSLALLILLITGLGLNISTIIDLIGSNGILALLLFVVGSLLIGLLLGGRNPGVSSVMGLGTAQRNVSAAIVVSAQNFSGTMTLPFVLVAAIVMLLILLPTAKRLGARNAAATGGTTSQTPGKTDSKA